MFRSPTALVVLSGGQSRRMGGPDKALLEWDDRPFLVLPFERSRGLFHQRILVANCFSRYRQVLRDYGWIPTMDNGSKDKQDPGRRIDLVSDQFPGQGPVAGIHAGLSRTGCPRALVLACDMPFVCREVMIEIVRAYDRTPTSQPPRGTPVLVPVVDGRRQPLCGVYHRKSSSGARECLEAGERSMGELLDRLDVVEWDPGEGLPADPETVFFNVNRPGDLETARRRQRSGHNR